MSNIVQQLVALTSAVRYDELPEATVAAAKRAILDALGCAIAAIGCEPCAIAARVVPKGSADTTIIGERGRGSVERAVLLNGILVRYLDLMDVYWAKDICHPAENVPLALACVELKRGGGKALIESVVAGYEAQLRLAHALSLTDLGMHHVTAAGIVAPLVVGKAWKLEPATIEQAVALSGCRQWTLHALSKGGLSMAKAIGYAWSAMSSVLATRLAQEGFSGPTDFLDWLSEHGGPIERAQLEHDAYLVERVSFKQFPVQFELQTPAEIAVRLHAKLRESGSAPAAIEIKVRPSAIARIADPAKFTPKNRETADHSLPVCVAMALLDGKLTAHQFESDRWASPDVAALVARIKVTADAEYDAQYPRGRAAFVHVTLENGNVLSDFQEVPSGDAERPLDDDALTRKFMANTEEKLGRNHAREVLECVKHLESVGRIDELTHLLAPV